MFRAFPRYVCNEGKLATKTGSAVKKTMRAIAKDVRRIAESSKLHVARRASTTYARCSRWQLGWRLDRACRCSRLSIRRLRTAQRVDLALDIIARLDVVKQQRRSRRLNHGAATVVVSAKPWASLLCLLFWQVSISLSVSDRSPRGSTQRYAFPFLDLRLNRNWVDY